MQETTNVIIIGGSIAGLMHGVMLKSLNYNVRILEARRPDQLAAQAAGLSLGPDAVELMERYIPALETASYSMTTPIVQFLGPDGGVVAENATSIPVVTSDWNVVFSHLKREFERPINSKRTTVYETERRVTGITDSQNSISIEYTRGSDKSTSVITADIVIAADGAFSQIRKLLKPDVQPEYSGILAWRGCIPETKIPDELQGVYEGKLLMTRADNSYLITYLTPGRNGSIAEGDRLMDWVWYDGCSMDSPDFANIMTDNIGHRHRVTVPRGRLDDTIWERRCDRARTVLPSVWSEMVVMSDSPFVTAVTGFACGKASYLQGKLFLAGDAFIQFRPHLGSSCNLPALQALRLAEVLKGNMSLENWETEVVSFGQEFALRSIAAGQYGMTGAYPPGYVPLYEARKQGSS